MLSVYLACVVVEFPNTVLEKYNKQGQSGPAFFFGFFTAQVQADKSKDVKVLTSNLLDSLDRISPVLESFEKRLTSLLKHYSRVTVPFVIIHGRILYRRIPD